MPLYPAIKIQNHLHKAADVSLPTRAPIDRTNLALLVCLHEAAGSLSTFYFDDAYIFLAQDDIPPTLRATSFPFCLIVDSNVLTYKVHGPLTLLLKA